MALMIESVSRWLAQIGLSQYSDSFAENAIDLQILQYLTDDDLKELGVGPLGHRKTMLKAIGKLSDDEEASRISASTTTPDGPGKQYPVGGLAAWQRHPGERKPVTLLFADITGSTALTEKLDAELTHELIYGAIQKMCEVVEECRGTVCRFMGDGVMAMFGAPKANEFHAIDACRASLRMLEVVETYASKVSGEATERIRIRVGLHSGEVVVLTVGDGDRIEYDASGPAVPIAARMEQNARPGTVLITAATYQLVAHRIEVKQLDPVKVKGISEPQTVYLLRQVLSVEEAPRSQLTRFVGRQGEINQFRSILETCIDTREGQTLVVRGEPGIGKTRLVEEFSRIASNKGAHVHRTRVLDFGAGRGQDAIRSLVRGLLGMTSEDPATARVAVESAIREALTPDQAVYLNDLLDLAQPAKLRGVYDAMDSATRNYGKRSVVSGLVKARCRDRPLLIVVEDLHWASPLTLAHVSNLCRTVCECSAILIATTRIDGDPLDRAWRSTTEGSPLFTLDLGPLRRRDSMEIIGEYMQLNGEIAERCAERAAGNPLYLEQLIHSAASESIEVLPDSIQSLILTRIDKLDDTDKIAIQAASVIGQRFTLDCLQSLLGDTGFDCSRLLEEGLIRRDENQLQFNHALTREGVYASLVKTQRKAFHSAASTYFEESDPILYAEHLARAGDPRAAEAYLEAARAQSSMYRVEAALDLIESALNETPPLATRHSALCFKGELLQISGQREASIAVWRDAVASAPSGEERCTALIGIASCLRLSSDHEEALAILDEAEREGGDNITALTRSRMHNLRGNLYFPTGMLTRCENHHQLAMEYAIKADSDEARANALSGLADVAYLHGRLITSEKLFRQCVDLCRVHGFGRIEAANTAMMAISSNYLLDLKKSEKLALDGLRFARQVGNRRGEMTSLRGLMVTLRLSGQWAGIGDLVEQYSNLNKVMGMRSWNGFCEHSKAVYLFATGDIEAAMRSAEKAIKMDKENAVHFNLCRALGTLALLLQDEDETRAVLSEADHYLDRDLVSHSYLWFYRDGIWAACKLRDWDLVERYADELEAYTIKEPLPFSSYYVSQARTLVALARNVRDEPALALLRNLSDQASESGLQMDAKALTLVADDITEHKELRFPGIKQIVM
ncbi:adenylate/guanylate cyclase domain-containing protein [Pseudomonadota bacterium]